MEYNYFSSCVNDLGAKTYFLFLFCLYREDILDHRDKDKV